MRISDWSSDVCSSDLVLEVGLVRRSPFLVGRDHFDAGQPKPQGPPPNARIEVDCLRRSCFLTHTTPELIRGHPSIDPLCQLQDLFIRSEEHTSELQSLMRISYAVFCLKKKKKNTQINNNTMNYSIQHRYEQERTES